MNIEQINISTPENVSLKFKIAGLGSRGAAYLIDWLILVIATLIIAYSMIKLEESLYEYIGDLSGYFIAALIISYFLLWGGYFVFFEYFAAGRTLGKKLIGIRVIQDNGQSLTFLSSFLRNVFRIVDFLPALYFTGIIMLFFNSKHKRIGDLVAGTIVVHERRGKTKKRKKVIDKEIEKRGIEPNNIILDQWTRNKFRSQEWNILNTYIHRWQSLGKDDRKEMTQKVANLLLPFIGIETNDKSIEELENSLFVLYLLLKDDWEYETRG